MDTSSSIIRAALSSASKLSLTAVTVSPLSCPVYAMREKIKGQMFYKPQAENKKRGNVVSILIMVLVVTIVKMF